MGNNIFQAIGWNSESMNAFGTKQVQKRLLDSSGISGPKKALRNSPHYILYFELKFDLKYKLNDASTVEFPMLIKFCFYPFFYVSSIVIFSVLDL